MASAFLSALLIVTNSVVGQVAPQLDGVVNFREVSGYITSDGQVLRSHTLYRSGELSEMKPDAKKGLKELGIRTEIDLRGPDERSKHRTHRGSWKPRVFTPLTDLKVKPKESDQDVYDDIAFKHGKNIGAALRDMSRAKTPVLIHCAAGNDRTGVSMAVLMKLLGMSEADIDREYLLSNDYWMKKGEKTPPLNQKLLDDTFTRIDSKYGSFDGYTKNALGLRAEDVESLRRKLLAPVQKRS